MTAIWRNDGRDWTLLAPSRFPDEATLHRLIEEAPHLLPLAGSPQLIVVGKEVRLGAGYADLIAVEPDGRLCVIEIKLAKNAEARKAIVAQALSYAAYLYRMDPEQLERDVLRSHLNGHASLADAVQQEYEEGEFDPEEFAGGLRNCLQHGHMRVVFVLDEAPPELVQLLGFLEAVSDGLILDLVTVSAYDINGSQVLVPQRVEPRKFEPAYASDSRSISNASGNKGVTTSGADAFIEEVGRADVEHRPGLERLVRFAQHLEEKGLAQLFSFRGVHGRRNLLIPRVQPENAGLIALCCERGPAIQFRRTVIERLAPLTLKRIEDCIGPSHVRQGNYYRPFDDALLDLLTEAYIEAADRHSKGGLAMNGNGVVSK